MSAAVVNFTQCPCCAGEDVDLFAFTLGKNGEQKLNKLCTSHLNKVYGRLVKIVKNGEVKYVA